MFTLLLAAFALVLSRSSGSADFAIGSLFANRAAPRHRDAVGYFVNLLALRFEIPEGEDTDELIRRTRRTVGGALGHQDVPFHLLPGDVTGAIPGHVQSVVFHMLSTPTDLDDSVRTGALDAASVDFGLALLSTRFDLELVVADSEQGLDLVFRYVPEACTTLDAGELATAYTAVTTELAGGRGPAAAHAHEGGHDCDT